MAGRAPPHLPPDAVPAADLLKGFVKLQAVLEQETELLECGVHLVLSDELAQVFEKLNGLHRSIWFWERRKQISFQLIMSFCPFPNTTPSLPNTPATLVFS
jgi:hypothetical protein